MGLPGRSYASVRMTTPFGQADWLASELRGGRRVNKGYFGWVTCSIDLGLCAVLRICTPFFSELGS